MRRETDGMWVRVSGRLGIGASAAVWSLSICSLALSMRLSLAAANAARLLRLHNAAPEVSHLHAGAVWFALGCTMLQLGAGLLMAYTLRAAYRLRTAACYAVAIVLTIAANVVALFGLLVWMHLHEAL